MPKISIAERLESSLAECAQLSASLSDATTKLAEVQAQLDERAAAIVDLSTKLGAAEESIKAKSDEHVALVASMEQYRIEAEAAAASAAAKLSLKAFADIGGTDPVADGGDANSATKSLIEQFNAITDPAARTKFYRLHQNDLLKERK